MRTTYITMWWVQQRFIWRARLHRFAHFVEYLQYNTFSPILPSFDYRECVHYVVNGVAGCRDTDVKTQRRART